MSLWRLAMSTLAILGGTPIRKQPFTNWPFWDANEVEKVSSVVSSGKWWRYEGEQVKLFEEKFAQVHDSKFALCVTNGTTSLEIALSCLGVGPGDEVIVPSYTFFATASAVVMNGAKVVFGDIESDTYNLDPLQLDKLITKNTKGIIPVHFAGMPAKMDVINEIAKKHGLFVLEDAAHAHGGKYKERALGSWGNASSFSFQASKNMTSGEGGAILTSDSELYESMVARHSFGRRPNGPWYEHFDVSTNARMTEMQAALLLCQLERLNDQTTQRKENAQLLYSALAQIPQFGMLASTNIDTVDRAYHLFIFKYLAGIEGVNRNTFIRAMNAEGIPLSSGYIHPLYRQPVFVSAEPPVAQNCKYSQLYHAETEKAVKESIWIPQNALIGDSSQVMDIINSVEKVIENSADLVKARL